MHAMHARTPCMRTARQGRSLCRGTAARFVPAGVVPVDPMWLSTVSRPRSASARSAYLPALVWEAASLSRRCPASPVARSLSSGVWCTSGLRAGVWHAWAADAPPAVCSRASSLRRRTRGTAILRRSSASTASAPVPRRSRRAPGRGRPRCPRPRPPRPQTATYDTQPGGCRNDRRPRMNGGALHACTCA